MNELDSLANTKMYDKFKKLSSANTGRSISRIFNEFKMDELDHREITYTIQLF